jgi:signal transduction histidine kinase
VTSPARRPDRRATGGAPTRLIGRAAGLGVVLPPDPHGDHRPYDDVVLTPLRSSWDEPRIPDPPPPTRWDWALVGAVAAVAVVEGVLRTDLPGGLGAVVVIVALAPTLLWRRSRPLAAVAVAFVVAAGAVVVTGEQSDLVASAAMLALPYALYRWGSGRDAATGTMIILGSIAVTMVVVDAGPADVLGSIAVVGAAMALGAAMRYRSRARARELEQVTLHERERLARDLHDTVAHHVSAIAIRAQAGLAASAADPAVATDALRVIEAESTRTLAEMRAMVRVLRRGDDADLVPVPTLADIAGLARDLHGGPAVTVELDGDVDDLPEPVAAAIYRLAQEAVTNALRHARHATRVRVRVTADDASVRLHVDDDGRAVGRTVPGRGYGIAGMVERASLLGGTCDVGPGPEGGWVVEAVLPRSGVAS